MTEVTPDNRAIIGLLSIIFFADANFSWLLTDLQMRFVISDCIPHTVPWFRSLPNLIVVSPVQVLKIVLNFDFKETLLVQILSNKIKETH